MSSYKYSEPTEPEFEPFEEGDYEFYVVDVQETYENNNGNFILPVEIQIKNTNITIRSWLSAGKKKNGKPFDMIAPFLKCIRRNPAVDEEPDFSAKNLIGAKGTAHCAEELYTGDNPKYKEKKFPGVAYWIYDREQTNATVSRGPDAPAKSYNKPAGQTAPSTATQAEDDDSIPF